MIFYLVNKWFGLVFDFKLRNKPASQVCMHFSLLLSFAPRNIHFLFLICLLLSTVALVSVPHSLAKPLYLCSRSLRSLTLPWIATKSHYELKPPRAQLSQVSTFPQICYLSHRELQLNNHSCLSQVSTFLPNLLFKPEPPLSQLTNLGSRVPLNSCNYHRFTVTVSHHETLLSARHRPSLWATIITMYAILLLVVSNFIVLQYCYADQLIIV